MLGLVVLQTNSNGQGFLMSKKLEIVLKELYSNNLSKILLYVQQVP